MNSDALTDLVVEALDDVKARDIVRLDVRDMTAVTDFMVVASGTSNRHVNALVDNVEGLVVPLEWHIDLR